MRWAAGCVGALVAPWLVLVVYAASLDAPSAALVPEASTRLLDRSGQHLATVRDADGELMEPVRLASLSAWVVPALIAAEDARFYAHPGIDPLAMLRAGAQALRRGRVVSGASTITQQLARTLFPRPRTLWGKWRELGLSLRLEAELDKASILEAYLNRVGFGPRLRGIGAASRHYFDKPAGALSLGEAAALVAIVKSPARYDPARFPERLRQRRDSVLQRMLRLGLAEQGAVDAAERAPIALHSGYVLPGAFHFVRAAVRGDLGPAAQSHGVLRSTLDGALQREVEASVKSFGARFSEHRASAAAVLVVDNEAGAVRAYVGSPDYRAREALGQNDGVLALRQPGSTLKPFVYALAMRDLGLHAASVLPDLERRFASLDGQFVPHNYDRRFHGPVRLGAALAGSLNVPAVTLAERLGPARVVDFLRSVGFSHLEGTGQGYGPAIALGVAEVQLFELAAAYATLARGGSYLPLSSFEADARATPRQALPPELARQTLAILADPRERAATFGRDGPLEFPFAVAVKTGTSKGNRDNWVVGVTPALTVAVWVGNFDGSPMLRSSGATGAGPLFHAVMEAATRQLDPGALSTMMTASSVTSASSAPAEERVVCTLSGELAGPDCPERSAARFFTRDVPHELCSWHRRVCEGSGAGGLRRGGAVSGGSAGESGCSAVEVLPDRYAAWAHDSGRVPPSRRAAPGLSLPLARREATQIVFPTAAARFVLDPHLEPGRQELLLSARAAPDARLSFSIDGREVCTATLPFRCTWALQRGGHEFIVREDGGRSASVRFSVD